MNCPKCNVPLSMADRQGVEIDFCPQCRGVWLDRGELDKIIERSGFSAPAATPPAPAPPQVSVFVYDEGEFHIRMNPGRVELVLPDRTLVLPNVPAASGARYEGWQTLFWNQGNEARLEIDGKVYTGCIRRPG